MNNLHSLRANNCHLSTENVSAFLPKLTNLRELYLAHNFITSPASWLKPLTELASLDLFGNTEFVDPDRVVCALRNTIETRVLRQRQNIYRQRVDLGMTKTQYCNDGDDGQVIDRTRCAPNCPWFRRGDGRCDARSSAKTTIPDTYNLCANKNCSYDNGDCLVGKRSGDGSL
jgi:hypothetical protein